MTVNSQGASQVEIERLEADLKKARSDNEHYQRDILDLQARIDALEAQNKIFDEQNILVCKRIAELEEDIAGYVQANTDMLAKIEQYEQALIGLGADRDCSNGINGCNKAWKARTELARIKG